MIDSCGMTSESAKSLSTDCVTELHLYHFIQSNMHAWDSMDNWTYNTHVSGFHSARGHTYTKKSNLSFRSSNFQLEQGGNIG